MYSDGFLFEEEVETNWGGFCQEGLKSRLRTL